MKPSNIEPDDPRLGALLRESRPSPPLPPRFQENVWRRIEGADAPVKATGDATWLDVLATWVLRPRFAFATAAALVLAGILLGAHEGTQIARQDAQARYLAAVAPNVLR